jgi:hypothetical protein
MHWKTYASLRKKYLEAERAMGLAAIDYFGPNFKP